MAGEASPGKHIKCFSCPAQGQAITPDGQVLNHCKLILGTEGVLLTVPQADMILLSCIFQAARERISKDGFSIYSNIPYRKPQN